jgi:hypothetical protein
VSEFCDIHGEFENVRMRMLRSIEVVHLYCSAVFVCYSRSDWLSVFRGVGWKENGSSAAIYEKFNTAECIKLLKTHSALLRHLDV